MDIQHKNISVIGIGRLGLAWALVLEKAGFNVIGCDINENYVKSINDKSFKSFRNLIISNLGKNNFAKDFAYNIANRGLKF